MEPNPEHGLALNFDPDFSEAIHDFCGPNGIAGAECPTCSKPLLRLLSLSAADARLNVDPAVTPVIHLLYCWTCSIPYGDFSYRIQQDGTVELLEIPATWEAAFGPNGPYDGHTGTFQLNKVGLIPLTEEETETRATAQSDTDFALDLPLQKHQIGGFPYIANPQAMTCPKCLNPSPFFAAICDDATGNQPDEISALQSFTDNPSLQMVFHFCRACSVVSAYHSND
jgi:hypothetical protein